MTHTQRGIIPTNLCDNIIYDMILPLSSYIFPMDDCASDDDKDGGIDDVGMGFGYFVSEIH